MNKSNLPLPVALKIEGEFFMLTKELTKAEQKIKFKMNVKESRSLAIHFNNALIKSSNIAQLFHGKIKAFSLGKLQGTVILQAKLCYPTVEFSSFELNIANNMLPRAYNLTITNTSKIAADFKLNFKESSMIFMPIREKKQENLMNVAQCLMKQKRNLRRAFFMPDSNEREVENILNEVDEIEDKGETFLDELHVLKDIKVAEVVPKTKSMKTKSKTSDHQKTPSTKDTKLMKHEKKPDLNCDVEVTIKDIQKYFKRLTRGLSEVFIRKQAKIGQIKLEKLPHKKVEKSAESFLKLSQSCGRLKPCESREISIMFMGSAEGELDKFMKKEKS